jgi:hypothetical protein
MRPLAYWLGGVVEVVLRRALLSAAICKSRQTAPSCVFLTLNHSGAQFCCYAFDVWSATIRDFGPNETAGIWFCRPQAAHGVTSERTLHCSVLRYGGLSNVLGSRCLSPSEVRSQHLRLGRSRWKASRRTLGATPVIVENGPLRHLSG